MTIEPVLIAVITVLAAAAGWWFVHYLTSKRDLRNHQRNQRVEYLVETFKDLVELRTYGQDPDLDYVAIVVRVTNSIQIFGTNEQIELFRVFVESINGRGGFLKVHELIDSIRNDIRETIGMDRITDTVPMLQVAPRKKSTGLATAP
jgi:hypothetical protein